MILYLNDPLRIPEDGGQLRCWLRIDNEDETNKDVISEGFEPSFDVQPTGGTLSFFTLIE